MVRYSVLFVVSSIVVTNTGAALPVKALTHSLLYNSANLAAGVSILPVYIDISEAFYVKESDSFTGKGGSLTADVLLLAEAVGVC